MVFRGVVGGWLAYELYWNGVYNDIIYTLPGCPDWVRYAGGC